MGDAEKKVQLVKPAAALVPPERKPRTPAEFKTGLIPPQVFETAAEAQHGINRAAAEGGAVRSAAGVRGGSDLKPVQPAETPFAVVEGAPTTQVPAKAGAPVAQSQAPKPST